MNSLLFIISFVLFVTAYLIPSYFFGAKKVMGKSSRESAPASPPARAVDVGVLGTLKMLWKVRSVFWDGTPTYAKALDVLGHYKKSFVRTFYPINWKSIGRIVLCSDLKTIREVSLSFKWLNRVDDDHYIYVASFGKPFGILVGNGPYWKAARKTTIKGFREHGILDVSHLEQLFSQEIHPVLNNLRDRVKESTTAVFSPNHLVDQATLNVIFKMLFSRKPCGVDPLEKRLAEKMDYNNENFCPGLSAIDFLPFLKYFPMLVPSARENLKFCTILYDIIANERERRTRTDSVYQDIMDTFLKEVEAQEASDPNYFPFENLQVTIRDLIVAGSDTIHVTMQHLLFFMASNRNEQRKVQDEIDRVVGPDRFPTYDDRKSMIYTQAVIQETWRLGSIAPFAVRVNSEDCQLGGLDIKKGTYFAPLYLAVNHSEELWEEPMEFKPARFISDSGQITNTDKTLTFSCGPRACPGELVGRVAVFLFTVALLREFDWELSDLHPLPSSQCGGGLTRTRAEYYVKIRRRTYQF